MMHIIEKKRQTILNKEKADLEKRANPLKIMTLPTSDIGVYLLVLNEEAKNYLPEGSIIDCRERNTFGKKEKFPKFLKIRVLDATKSQLDFLVEPLQKALFQTKQAAFNEGSQIEELRKYILDIPRLTEFVKENQTDKNGCSCETQLHTITVTKNELFRFLREIK